jgi:hypothetical protein
MDVGPVGAGPAGAEFARGTAASTPLGKPAASTLAQFQQTTAAIDAAALSILSEPDLTRLAAILESPPAPQAAAHIAELARAVISAAAAGDLGGVLSEFTQLAAASPLRAEAVRSDPALEPMRAQVDSLLARLAQVAKLDAESRVSQASQILEQTGVQKLAGWDVRPEALLLLANRLLEAGGHVNFNRASQLALTIAEGVQWAPAPAAPPYEESTAARLRSEIEPLTGGPIRTAFSRSWDAVREQAPARVRALWRRAPLLILLLVWLAVGIVGGTASWLWRILAPDAWPAGFVATGFDLWALGFLALVVFGFYMRVRHVRL